jgi:hypothetical protein
LDILPSRGSEQTKKGRETRRSFADEASGDLRTYPTDINLVPTEKKRYLGDAKITANKQAASR